MQEEEEVSALKKAPRNKCTTSQRGMGITDHCHLLMHLIWVSEMLKREKFNKINQMSSESFDNSQLFSELESLGVHGAPLQIAGQTS